MIADFFSVTVDELLGVDKSRKEEQANKYIELYDKHGLENRALTFAEFQKGIKEFPYDFRILVRYMELLRDEKDYTCDRDYQKTSDELLSVYERIQNNCTDDDIRIWSKHLICEHLMRKYDCLGFDEKYLRQAEDIISTMPALCDSKEYISAVNSRESWMESCEKAIEELLYLLQNVIITYCYYNDEFSPEYKINVIKHMNELFGLVDSDEHYSKNRIHIIYNYGRLGQLYFAVGDKENAFRNLKICAEYAKAFDENPIDTERIYCFYEKEKVFCSMKMCERMTKLMTEHYKLLQSFKSEKQFEKIIDIMK